MLIIDAQYINPLSAFYKVRQSLNKLSGVTSSSVFKRKNTDSILHFLKKFDDYIDAIYRFSYQTKTDSKAEVPKSFRRTFGSSPIKDQYFYIYEDIMKPKIVMARTNDSLTFIHSDDKFDQAVNFQYQQCRKCTYCFHMQNRKTLENIGFLGLQIEQHDFEEELYLHIEVESMYIKAEFKDHENCSLFIKEIKQFISRAIDDCKLKLKANQKMVVSNATSYMSCYNDFFLSELEDLITFLCPNTEIDIG